jgi:hypothetical protein
VVKNFLALYRGPSVAQARLIAVSSEPEIVGWFLRELAGVEASEERDECGKPESLHIVRSDEE